MLIWPFTFYTTVVLMANGACISPPLLNMIFVHFPMAQNACVKPW